MTPAGLLILAALVLPLGYLLRVSFLPSGEVVGHASGLSFQNYLRIFGDPFYRLVLRETLETGVLVTLLTLALGFPLGHSLARQRGNKRVWRTGLVLLPLTVSLVVNVFGWLVILGNLGLVNQILAYTGLADAPLKLLYSRTAVTVVLTQIALPFQVLSVMSVVANIDPSLEEASANLRASRPKTFFTVILPLAWPGIVAGSTLVFMLTVTAFVTPQLVGGVRTHMIGPIIYEQMIVVLDWPFGAALAVVLLLMSLGTLLLGHATLRRRRAKI